MNALRLTRTDFDTLENKVERALCVEDLGTFVDGDGKTAFQKVGEVLAAQEVSPYLAWDGNVYPTFAVEKVTLQ